MAGIGSRFEKFGSIFSRMTGLMRSGAMKTNDKPCWYDVYAAHPPKVEPTMSRPPPSRTPIDIVYVEDYLRVKFYQKYGNNAEVIDLLDESTDTNCQRFVKTYLHLEKSSSVDRNYLLEAVEEHLRSEGINLIPQTGDFARKGWEKKKFKEEASEKVSLNESEETLEEQETLQDSEEELNERKSTSVEEEKYKAWVRLDRTLDFPDHDEVFITQRSRSPSSLAKAFTDATQKQRKSNSDSTDDEGRK